MSQTPRIRQLTHALALVLGMAALPAHAKLVQEIIKIPMVVYNGYGKVVAQDSVVTIFVDDKTPCHAPS